MNQILGYVLRMMPAVVPALGLWAVTRPLRRQRLRRKGLRGGAYHEAGLAAFFVLVAGLLWLTVLPRLGWEGGRLTYAFEGFGLINLKPFVIFKHSKILGIQYFLINFIGNIAMFLPIGFFPPLLWRKGTWWKAMLLGLTLSCCIELCQIPIQRGCDVDDVWLNTVGAMAGYGLYRAVERRARGRCEKFRVTEEEEI